MGIKWKIAKKIVDDEKNIFCKSIVTTQKSKLL